MNYENKNALEVLSSIIELSITTYNHQSGGQINLSSRSARQDLATVIARNTLSELSKMTVGLYEPKGVTVAVSKPPMHHRWMPPSAAVSKYKKVQEDTDPSQDD